MSLCTRFRKTSDEANRSLVKKKNDQLSAAFASIPFRERIIFVPHCMRSVASCKAKEMGSYYLCVECGACKIAPISKRSKQLGYKALYILKGGRTMDKLMADQKPGAVIGVACFYEGAQGIKLAEKHGVKVQCVPLTRDGCSDTDVDLDEVMKVVEKK